MSSKVAHLGAGLYSVAEAAKLTGASHETVRRWLGEKEGVVARRFEQDEGLLSFDELIEIYFIQLFRDHGVSFATIRRASESAARRFHSEYPFAVKRFDTDGRTIFATLLKQQPSRSMTEDLAKGQYVFTSVMKPFFKKLEYRRDNQRVARFWPRSKQGRVVLDPAVKFGRPIDAETGVTTSSIYDAVRAGQGQKPEVVAKWFDIPTSAVLAAVDFERSLEN